VEEDNPAKGSLRGDVNMAKKATIKVLLVEESAKTTDEKIEKEIFEELSKSIHTIPWAARIEKVKVSSS